MKTRAFKMQLNEGQKKEYIKRHKEIWPEFKQLLKNAGISEYSIFLDEETNVLFAFQKISIHNETKDLKDDPLVIDWWNFMADIMKVNPDNSPISTELEEVFRLD